jgi:zinc transporter ZupT
MLSALLFGVVASSALVIGAVAGAYWRPPRFLLASALAFASGSLITALAYDLFEESFNSARPVALRGRPAGRRGDLHSGRHPARPLHGQGR